MNENRPHRYPLGSHDAGDPPRLLPFLAHCGNPPLVESVLALRDEIYQGVHGLLRVVPFRPDGYLLLLLAARVHSFIGLLALASRLPLITLISDPKLLGLPDELFRGTRMGTFLGTNGRPSPPSTSSPRPYPSPPSSEPRANLKRTAFEENPCQPHRTTSQPAPLGAGSPKSRRQCSKLAFPRGDTG